jgi:hypothetical protein
MQYIKLLWNVGAHVQYKQEDGCIANIAEGLLFPFSRLLCLGNLCRRWGQITGAGKIVRGITNRKLA